MFVDFYMVSFQRHLKQNSQGFTLVELLLVVTVLGILSAVTISTLNQQAQRERAADVVRLAQLEQANQAIQSFEAVEGYYPPEVGGVPTDTKLSEYLINWPAGVEYRVDSSTNSFAIYTELSDNNFNKFSTAWEGVAHCSPTNIDSISVCVTPGGTTPSVTSLSLSPSPVLLTVGGTQQLTATATYSDGTSTTVSNSTTWTITVPNVVTVSSSGFLTAVGSGSTNVSGSFGGQTASVTVNVTNVTPTVASVTVTPTSVALNVGGTQQFTATATYTDGSSSNVTNSAVWNVQSLGGGTVASVNSTGLATAQSVGSAIVRASYSGFTGSASITVGSTGVVLTSIDVSPKTMTLTIGQTGQLTVNAIYSDGSIVDVTGKSTYSVGQIQTYVSVDASGLVTGVSDGSAIVTAHYSGFSADSNITVSTFTGGTLDALVIAPTYPTIAIGESLQLRAFTRDSLGNLTDVTSSTSWSVSSFISTITLKNGLVTGVSSGTTVVQADYKGETASTYVTVSSSSTF